MTSWRSWARARARSRPARRADPLRTQVREQRRLRDHGRRLRPDRRPQRRPCPWPAQRQAPLRPRPISPTARSRRCRSRPPSATGAGSMLRFQPLGPDAPGNPQGRLQEAGRRRPAPASASLPASCASGAREASPPPRSTACPGGRSTSMRWSPVSSAQRLAVSGRCCRRRSSPGAFLAGRRRGGPPGDPGNAGRADASQPTVPNRTTLLADRKTPLTRTVFAAQARGRGQGAPPRPRVGQRRVDRRDPLRQGTGAARLSSASTTSFPARASGRPRRSAARAPIEQGPGNAKSWTGSLAVSFLGAPHVPLTGSPFVARLARGW